MKKLFFITLFAIISSFAYSQKLEINEIDEFTGTSVKRTSWESFHLNKKGGHMTYFRISKLDNLYYFEIKLMFQPSRVFSIHKDAKMMFILEDKTVYNLKALDYVVSSQGGGAIKLAGSAVQGAHITYISDGEDMKFDVLEEKKITKIRIYTSDGYIDSEVTDKVAQTVINAIVLVDK